jgi:hypothetical protein
MRLRNASAVLLLLVGSSVFAENFPDFPKEAAHFKGNPSQFAQHYSRLRFAPAIASCYNMRDEHFQ